MKPWKPLLALFGLALVVTPAVAAVQFHGLQFSSQGACVADVDASGRLLLSNLGSSGQDGVSIWSPRSNGARVVLSGTCSSADAGSVLRFVHAVHRGGQLSTTPISLRASVTATGLSFDCDFSQVSSSSTVTVCLYLGGELVSTRVVDKASPVLLRFSNPLVSSLDLPVLSISERGGKATPKLCEAHVSFSSTCALSVAGGPDEDCDDAVFRCTPDEDCDGASSALFVTAPPGSSLSSVRCQDGSCRLLDHWVSGTGQASLDLDTHALPSSSSATRRLPVHNLGSSGQDGVSFSIDRVAPPVMVPHPGRLLEADDAPVSLSFAAPSLSFDPSTDVGKSVTLTINGWGFSSSSATAPVRLSPRVRLACVAGSCASGACSPPGVQVTFDHTDFGTTLDSAAVLDHGVEVARFALPPGSSVFVHSPVGEPEAIVVVAGGGKKEFKGHVTLLKTPMMAAGPAGSVGPDAVERTFAAPHVFESCAFSSSKLFSVTGQPTPVGESRGDEIVAWSSGCSSGSCPDQFSPSSLECRVTSPPSSSSSSFDVAAAGDASADVIVADIAPSAAITTTQSCVSVPFVFSRTDATPVRAFSVTFHLSPELAACGASASVSEGSYLSSVAGTQMFVTDNGGGSYTVDCGILGPVCGATGSGTLFSLDIGASSAMPAGSSGFGLVSVDAVRVRDCSNAPVPADAGGVTVLAIQTGTPPAVTTLTATTQLTGNGQIAGITGGAVAGIVVARSGASTKQYVDALYRKPFGNYPLYDKGTSPGQAPTPPASEADALASGWTPVTCSSGACSSSSRVDVPPTRDFFSYCVFVRDAYGNASPCSNLASALDYHLGDVSDGLAVCNGDNLVSIADVSALGAHYGQAVSAGSSFTCLDVGPTTDFSVDARPTVDGRVEFEDFMMFALNFSVVSTPTAIRRPMPAASNATRLVVPTLPAVGQTFDVGVNVDGAGDMQGMSATLAFDPNVLEQVGVSAGSLLDDQGRPASVLSSGPGDVDAALLGTGPGIAGSGELARVTFRVKAAGDPGLALARLDGRDAANHPVALAGAIGGGSGVPARTSLGFAYPNPFRQNVGVQLSLRVAGNASVAVFDVAGRRVRTLVQGVQPAGSRVVTWDGRDDSGLALAPGAYIVRLETAGVRESRTVRLVR